MPKFDIQEIENVALRAALLQWRRKSLRLQRQTTQRQLEVISIKDKLEQLKKK